MNGTRIGTAFVDVQGDFTTLQQQVSTAIPGLSSKLGKGMAVGLAAGVASAGLATKALYDVGAAFDDSFDKIRVGTGKTGKELTRLKGDFKNVVGSLPTDFDSASEAITGLSQRLDITGKPLRALSKQMLELSRITDTDVKTNVQTVTRAFADWEVKTRDQGDALDFMYRAAQQSGATVDELAAKVVQFGAPLRQFGFDIEEATSMFALFEKAGVNVQTMVPGLKLALSDFLERGIDPEKGLLKTFRDIESGAMSSSEAIELFGKRAGADMVEAIKQGRFEFQDFTKTIANSKDTIRGAGRDTMDLAEHWQQFTNLLKVQVYPIAKDVFKGLGNLMKDVTKAFKQGGWEQVFDLLMEKLQAALPKVQAFALKLGGKLAEGLVKGFQEAPILTTLFAGGVLLKAFGGGSVIGTAGKALGKRFGGAFGAGLVTTGALAVVQLVSETKKTLEGHGSKSLSEMFEGEFDNIADAIKSSIKHDDLDGLLEVRKLLDAMRQSAINSGEDVPKELDRLIKATDKARARMGADLKGVIDKFDDFTDGGGDMADKFDKTADKLNSDADRLANGMTGAFKKVGKGINSLDKGIGKGLDNIGKNTNSLLKGLKVGEVSYSIKKAGEALQGFQRGGPINIGAPSGDSVPAVLERGEYVLNRRAVAALGKDQLDAINFNHAPRFQKGGVIEQALGPYSIGPIQYDPNHAGGNSHLHLDFFTQAQAIAYGKKMQGMGWNISEYSGPYGGFGGLTTTHQSPGHYDGTAFDANTAADETQAEVSAVAQLLGGGVSASMVDKIKRVILEGPKGPLRTGGQAALDKVRKAANALIKKEAAASVAGGVNAAMYSGPLDKNFGAGDNTQIPFNAAAMLAEKAGLPGITYAQIAIGESNLTPGAVSPDGGYGLWQMTPRVQSAATVNAWENVGTYFNPWNNAQQAKILAGSGTGTSNYFGIGSVTDWNKHYTGPMSFQRGGLVEMLAKGGQAGGRKPGMKITGPFGHMAEITGPLKNANPSFDVTGPAKFPGYIQASKAIQTAASLTAKLAEIERLDETIGLEQLMADRDGLFTADEIKAQVALNAQLLPALAAARDIAKAGAGTVLGGLSVAQGPNRETLLNLAPTFTGTITDMQGVTGKGGRITDTFLELARLSQTIPDVAGGRGSYLDAIEAMIAEAGLTPELTDDISGYTALVSYWEQALSGLKASGGSFSDIASAASSLKSARDTLASLTGSGSTSGSSSGSSVASELDALKLAQAMDTIRRLNVGIAQNSVFAGTFATGGNIPAGAWGIAGERGPEIVHGPAQVHSNRDSQSMLKPEVRVVLEDNRTIVTVDGQVEAIVDNKLNQIARGRSYAGAGRL